MIQHKADEAIGIYDRGLAKNSSDSALLCAKGIALKAAGKLEDAVRHYRHAIDLQPRVPEPHHNLALFYIQQGNTEEALAHLEKEVGLDPHAESGQHHRACLGILPAEGKGQNRPGLSLPPEEGLRPPKKSGLQK